MRNRRGTRPGEGEMPYVRSPADVAWRRRRHYGDEVDRQRGRHCPSNEVASFPETPRRRTSTRQRGCNGFDGLLGGLPTSTLRCDADHADVVNPLKSTFQHMARGDRVIQSPPHRDRRCPHRSSRTDRSYRRTSKREVISFEIEPCALLQSSTGVTKTKHQRQRCRLR